MEEKNNNVVIIGAGNVATHIARQLYEEGFRIRQVFSRTKESASALAATVDAQAICHPNIIDKSADIYVISVKDDAIAEVAPCLAHVQGMVVHTSGSIGIDIFEGKHIKHYGVFYPMQTFSKKRAVDFSEIPLFVEANDDDTMEKLTDFAKHFSEKITITTSEQRRQIHLAAVFANNFSNHMFTLANGILEQVGIPFEVLLPLINETSKKVNTMSPADAQTGPAIRYDKTVMNKHLRLIDDIKIKEIYMKISENIHTFAEKKKNE